MSGTVLVASLIGVALILVYLAIKLTERDSSGIGDYAILILLIGFLLGILLLLSKTAVDYEDNCGWLVNNSTVTGNTTSYNYAYTCSENTNNTATTFYNLTLWIVRLVTAYVIIGFFFQLFNYFGWWKKGGKQE